MIFTWNQILPAAIRTLNPVHQEIVRYLIEKPSKQAATKMDILAKWNLSTNQFQNELNSAISEIRQHFARYDINGFGDLELL